jgi:hypothetical protein
MEDAEKYKFIGRIHQAFTPGAPIDSRDLFAGRRAEVDKVISTVFQRGQHAVLFGERGVGKTSLANTLFDFLVLMGEFSYQRARINCAEGMSLADIWRAVFRQLTTRLDGEDVYLDQSVPADPNCEDIREMFQLMDDRSIVILDEFDRIKDPVIQRGMADTIKSLSDNSVNSTLVIVGVADSLGQLIAEHRSIERAIKQVPMPRMSKPELLEIINKGLTHCEGIAIESSARERIADYSQGLPSYTHLLCREAALQSVRSHRTYVMMQDLEHAVKEAVNSQLETTLSEYNNAVSSPRGNIYKPVLLSCALAQKDEHGYFYAKHVTPPLRVITSKAYEIPAFARHLKDFCENSRGPVLERKGSPKRVKYRFVKPLMEPYVILRGLADALITESQLNHPPATSTEPVQLSLLSPSAELG